jgi:hypothetical protein
LLIFNEAHLRRAISGYAAYFNYLDNFLSSDPGDFLG